MKKYNIILSFFFFVFTLYSIINIKDISSSTMQVITTFSKTILPALLPFLILNQIVIKIGIIDFIAYFFQFISYPLFKISGKGASIILIGLLNGFPSSVIFSSMMLNDKQIEKDEAQRLINCVFFPSISFLFVVIKTNLNDDFIFSKLVLSIYLGGFLFLYLSSFGVKESGEYISFRQTLTDIKFKLNNFTFSKNVKEIIGSSFNTLLNILGIIVIFSIPCNIIDRLLISNLSYLFKGLVEFSIPSISLSLLSINKKSIAILLCAILSFSGLSSIMQASLFISEANLDNRQFIINRILITITSISFLYLLFSNIFKNDFLYFL